MRLRRRFPVRCAVITLALLAHLSGTASADGAFPDSIGILLPTDQPRSIHLVTNFGLLNSDDAGATWRLSCEAAISPSNKFFLYQLGAPPTSTLYAISYHGIYVSKSGGCDWQQSAFPDPQAITFDAFADAADPHRALAIAYLITAGKRGPYTVFASRDGGGTFDTPLFAAPQEGVLSGVEIARSAPATVYLTMNRPDGHSFVLHSTDGGSSFATFDQFSALGPMNLGLAAVDPEDDNKLYLRLMPRTGTGDSLGISTDGGMTVRVAQSLPDPMTAFLRRADKTLLVSGKGGGSFRSRDGGDTFEPWATPHLRALAERDGVLYAAANSFVDGWALATSRDGGDHWTPLLHYGDWCGILECGNLASVCADTWDTLARNVPPHPAAACTANLPAMVDAAATPPSSNDAASTHAAAPPATGAVLAGSASGCSCNLGSARGSAKGSLQILVCVLLLFGRSYRIRSRRAPATRVTHR